VATAALEYLWENLDFFGGSMAPSQVAVMIYQQITHVAAGLHIKISGNIAAFANKSRLA
jgi:hypothetical protein